MAMTWQDFLSGAGAGATAGGAIGGPWGALGGGVLGGIGNLFSAKPDKFGEQNLQNPQQQQVLAQLLGKLQQSGGQGGNYQQSQDYLSKLLSRDPQTYDRFAAPYLQQFEEQVLPGIAERFSGLGGGLGGAQQSSGFAQALGGAGAGLQANLANLYANLQRGAATESMGQYNNLANLGLGTRAFQPYYQPGTTGFAGGVGQGVAQAAGQYGGKSLMEDLFRFLNKGNEKTGVEDNITNASAAGPYGGGATYNPYTGYQG